MSKHKLTPREIEQWIPRRLSDFVGCEEAIKIIANHLRNGYIGTNFFIEGETGSGKTTLIEVATRTLFCPNVTDPLAGPCWNCRECRDFDFANREEGLFAEMKPKAVNSGTCTSFFHVNCYELDLAGVRELRSVVNEFHADRTIIYLDEVQCLGGTQAEGVLLKAIRELDAVWIASGITSDVLSPMFVRRFAARCTTSLPKIGQIATFVQERCVEWEIEWDKNETIVLLSECCKGIIAECISVLALAAANERKLTEELVKGYRFVQGVRKMDQ